MSSITTECSHAAERTESQMNTPFDRKKMLEVRSSLTLAGKCFFKSVVLKRDSLVIFIRHQLANV